MHKNSPLKMLTRSSPWSAGMVRQDLTNVVSCIYEDQIWYYIEIFYSLTFQNSSKVIIKSNILDVYLTKEECEYRCEDVYPRGCSKPKCVKKKLSKRRIGWICKRTCK